MKKIITKRMFVRDVFTKTYDKEGKVIAKGEVLPYCLGCLFENDGEEVVNELNAKFKQALFCPVHEERFKKLMASREHKSN